VGIVRGPQGPALDKGKERATMPMKKSVLIKLLETLFVKYGLSVKGRLALFEFKIRISMPEGLPSGFKEDLDKLFSDNKLYIYCTVSADSRLITILEKGWPVW
jgi:hypothetical protein